MQRNKRDMTRGPIAQQILLFFLPVALGSFFQQMYNTADALVIGNFVGMGALAAVGGMVATLTNMIIGFFVGLSSGATVAIAQYYGAKNPDGIRKVVHSAAALTLLCGAFLTVAGIVLVPGALRLLNQPEELMADSTIYIRIYFAGIIPALIYNVGAGVLRAVGDSTRPMICLIVCCAANIVLDLFFVAVLRMAVAGAAIATVLAQTISAVLVTVRLIRTREIYRLSPGNIRFDRAATLGILCVGLPTALQSMVNSVSNLFLQSRINLHGADTIAAWTILGKVDGFVWLIMSALGVAVTTFVGQNYGARRMDRVHRAIYVTGGMTFAFTVLFSVLVVSLREPFYRIFGAEGETLRIGVMMLTLMGPMYSLYVPVEVLSGAMRGVGETLVPMLVTCVGMCCLTCMAVWIAGFFTSSIIPLIVCYPISWGVASIVLIFYYKSGRWLKRASKIPVQA